jgi:hypothetical protein
MSNEGDDAMMPPMWDCFDVCVGNPQRLTLHRIGISVLKQC